MISLKKLLELMISRGATDLHLSANSPPRIRVDGKLIPVGGESLTPQMVQEMAYSVMSERQRKTFEEKNELDFSFGVQKLSRFRVNVYRQRGSVAVAIRSIPYEILTLEELGLPPVFSELTLRPNGLILVTGPTGSGKSTTLAAMIDKINRERACHIVTIEDPIEFLHAHRRSLVNQRQVNDDTESFASALKHILRQDPDVVLIGEMRDMETIEATLTIAETGHLVLASLHTNSAAQTIHRIVDVFPPHRQFQIIAQLSLSLQAIISQQLLPRIGGGLVLALEILICTPAVRAVIRENKIHQLYSMMQIGQQYGMRTMNQSLCDLVKRGLVTEADAMLRSHDQGELEEMLSGRRAMEKARR